MSNRIVRGAYARNLQAILPPPFLALTTLPLPALPGNNTTPEPAR